MDPTEIARQWRAVMAQWEAEINSMLLTTGWVMSGSSPRVSGGAVTVVFATTPEGESFARTLMISMTPEAPLIRVETVSRLDPNLPHQQTESMTLENALDPTNTLIWAVDQLRLRNPELFGVTVEEDTAEDLIDPAMGEWQRAVRTEAARLLGETREAGFMGGGYGDEDEDEDEYEYEDEGEEASP